MILAGTAAKAQDLESIGKDNPVKVSGGVNLSQIFYAVDGIERRRDPYSYFLTGNLNLDLYGWSVPLSFSLSNRNSSFRQPFNRYGMHPTYKWATAHLGWASMNFSPYTLSGHLFRGAGVDLAPTEKFRVSAMYGRLQQAVEPDSLKGTQPFYRRLGYGLKARYGNGADHVDVILFRARDDESSLSRVPEEEDVLPQENLVLSVAGGKMLFGRLLLNAEWATTAITRDTRAIEIDPVSNRFFNGVGGLFTPRASSAYYNALRTGLTYRAERYSIGLGYERVDPGYRTLGAYFFNSDLRNITANGTLSLLGGKLNLGGNAGVQRDNLDDSKVSTMQRAVGSLNVAYAPGQKLNLNASYSNFRTFTNIRSQFVDINQLTPFDNLDTLNYTQISRNANLSVVYLLQGDREKRQNINMNLSFQDASDEQGGVEQNSGTQFYNINTAYSLGLVPRNMTVTAAFNLTRNVSGFVNSSTYGPTLSLNRSFFERRLRVTLSSSWNSSFGNGDRLNSVLNLRLNGGYTHKKKHNLNLSLVSLGRSSNSGQGAGAFTEFTGTLGYGYNF